MKRQEALEAIQTGHTIWSVEYARAVCDAFGVPFSEDLTQVYETDRHPLGVTMFHGPEAGVWSLSLSMYVAEQLGVKDQARGFIGRGSQAREYARLVAEKLHLAVTRG